MNALWYGIANFFQFIFGFYDISLSPNKENYDFHEFTEQYEEVYAATNANFLGIGVAIKKV